MNELMQNLIRLHALDSSEKRQVNIAANIADLRRKIPQQILKHYDGLRARGKKGVAEVRNQVCGGCHMQLTLGVIMNLRHGQDMQLCDSCGRYLYLVDDVAMAAAADVKAIANRAHAPRRAVRL